MSIFKRLFGRGQKSTPNYPSDDITINGKQLRLSFYAHASIAIEYEGRNIYVDPVAGHADYERLPKADMILVTHSHYDHFDRAAIESLQTEHTHILCDKSSAESFAGDCYTMLPGSVAEPFADIRVEAIAAYKKTFSLPDDVPLSLGAPGFFGDITVTKHMVAGLCDTFSVEMDAESYYMQNPHYLYNLLTNRRGWEWFDSVREDQRFVQIVAEAKVMSDTWAETRK